MHPAAFNRNLWRIAAILCVIVLLTTYYLLYYFLYYLLYYLRSFAAILCVIVPRMFDDTTVAFVLTVGFIFLTLLFGGAIIPSATGVIVAAVRPELRRHSPPLASSPRPHLHCTRPPILSHPIRLLSPPFIDPLHSISFASPNQAIVLSTASHSSHQTRQLSSPQRPICLTKPGNCPLHSAPFVSPNQAIVLSTASHSPHQTRQLSSPQRPIRLTKPGNCPLHSVPFVSPNQAIVLSTASHSSHQTRQFFSLIRQLSSAGSMFAFQMFGYALAPLVSAIVMQSYSASFDPCDSDIYIGGANVSIEGGLTLVQGGYVGGFAQPGGACWNQLALSTNDTAAIDVVVEVFKEKEDDKAKLSAGGSVPLTSSAHHSAHQLLPRSTHIQSRTHQLLPRSTQLQFRTHQLLPRSTQLQFRRLHTVHVLGPFRARFPGGCVACRCPCIAKI